MISRRAVKNLIFLDRRNSSGGPLRLSHYLRESLAPVERVVGPSPTLGKVTPYSAPHRKPYTQRPHMPFDFGLIYKRPSSSNSRPGCQED